MIVRISFMRVNMSVSFSLAGIYCFLQYFSQVSSGMASHRPHRQARAEAVPSTSAVSVQQGRVCGVSFFFGAWRTYARRFPETENRSIVQKTRMGPVPLQDTIRNSLGRKT